MIDLVRLDRLARRARLRHGPRDGGGAPGRRATRQRGLGASFAGHREYGFGDDVRHVDWRVTARLARPFVKMFQRETSGTVLVLVDASASIRDATGGHALTHRALEVAALVILMAVHAQDRVGAAQFTDRIEWLSQPRRGRAAAVAAIRAMERFQPASRRTSIATALAHAGHLAPAAATIIIVSDFIDRDYEPALATLRRRHALLALCLRHPLVVPGGSAGGLVRAGEPESGRTRWLDMSHPLILARLQAARHAHAERRRARLAMLNVPCCEIGPDHAPEIVWRCVGAHL